MFRSVGCWENNGFCWFPICSDLDFLVFFFPYLFGCWESQYRAKIFFFLGHRMGPKVPWPNGARGACEVGLGPTKEIRLLIGPGSGRGSKPAGRVRVWKNPTQTRPVAIPARSRSIWNLIVLPSNSYHLSIFW